MKNSARDRLIFALDVPTAAEALTWVELLRAHVGCFKVGLELFVAEGPALIKEIAGRAPVFLDLKLNDIPATVECATESACALGVQYLTVHIGDSGAPLAAAVKAAQSRVTLLGVTVLTSVVDEDLGDLGLTCSAAELVTRRADVAWRVGCKGLVCSPLEARDLRAQYGSELLLVTPGIRPAGVDRGDQRRVVGPAEAIAAGADMLVIGRAVRDAADPVAAMKAIMNAIPQ